MRIHVVAPLGPELIQPFGSRVGWVFVELETDEGLTGVGECSNWLRKGNILVAHALMTVRDWMIGRSVNAIEQLWSELFRRFTYLGNRGIVTTAMSGIDMALWDLRGQSLGKPVYDLLGGAIHRTIPLYTHPKLGTPDQVAQSTRALLADGYTALKTDPFQETFPAHTAYIDGAISQQGIGSGTETIAAVREAAGRDTEILIDLHGSYNVATAVQCIRALEPYDITWFEEPVPPEGHDALRQIRSQTSASLCVGERLFTRWDVTRVLEEGLVQYLMSDICWTGGITELRKIATTAEAFGVPLSPHNALGPLQIVAGGHAMAACVNCYRMEITSLRIPLYNAYIEPGLDIRGGVLHVPDRPGLGVELNHDEILAHPDPDWP